MQSAPATLTTVPTEPGLVPVPTITLLNSATVGVAVASAAKISGGPSILKYQLQVSTDPAQVETYIVDLGTEIPATYYILDPKLSCAYIFHAVNELGDGPCGGALEVSGDSSALPSQVTVLGLPPYQRAAALQGPQRLRSSRRWMASRSPLRLP